MKTVLDELDGVVKGAFETFGASPEEVEVSFSRRPDLCDFQCNSALRVSKALGLKPIELAEKVANQLTHESLFSKVSAEMPGFVNMTLSEAWLTAYLTRMKQDENLGVEAASDCEKVIVDFGGANVAKTLHVGHLRSAVIGESIIRILRTKGHEVIGDIHMGDWGLQMGFVIEMLRLEAPGLPYYNNEFSGAYPEEAPFDIEQLTALYTNANILSKEDPAFREKAAMTTAELQLGNAGYLKLWSHILAVSKEDLKKNYGHLQIHFDLWLGESDSQEAIPTIIEHLEKRSLLKSSENAKVVYVERPEDKKPMPPCIMQKENGASLYATTDLATIYQRVRDYAPDRVIYVVDKRQALHFEQVFRVSRLSEIAPEQMKLEFVGFGTMNGTDGKPFKTRDGGVMSLKELINQLIDTAGTRLESYSHIMDETEKKQVALAVGVGALKYGDLSNLPERDYVFDLDQFSNFEGKTGSYVQYAGVRISSILEKLHAEGIDGEALGLPQTTSEIHLMKKLAAFSGWVDFAADSLQPSKICDYVFEVSQAFNALYHDVHVMKENHERKQSLHALLSLTKQVIEKSLWLLGIEALEKM